ncbi:sugar phosphate isomerase/epimerase family protein [Novosphingobium sp. JCM 18896]|uniref:sugar phosphate isomerase/epimerase family protein n=1 Tax=Novosphingobium sp. JCM 18896 TaxID=2989731 RepID=UPI002222D937|nr:sugar phosphate isomerase/epimerase [Novosphingobium sp. JCM 18896]MCW1429499.1 sugar phosphate isomerase/epimerase [Novosphingobium sp. JCM 18896]
MIIGRRDLLRGGLGLSAAAALPISALSATARRRGRLGLADITVIKELARDYPGTLKAVAAMGYSHFGFRLAGYGGGSREPSAQDKARMVRDAGLEVGVVRLPPVRPDIDRQIADAVVIGAKVIAMSAAPPFISGRLGVTTRAAFDAWLPELAALGAKCRAAGLTLAYHNHWWDLMPLDGGESPLDIILRSVPPGDLAIELDLAWCWYGGVAPLDLLARLGPRVSSMHLKDIDRSRGKSVTDHAVTVGSGEMGYAALLPRLRRLTSAVGYIEVDSPPDGLVAAAEGARFVQAHS